jgi:hypothetical protein
MKGKLIKQNGIIDGVDYYLILDGKIYHTNPLTSGLVNGGKLSKQNCDEIFGKLDIYYDAVDYAARQGHPSPEGFSDEQVGLLHGYIDGFNKAMELNKDKLYTIEDMEEAIQFGLDGMYGYETGEDGTTKNQMKRFIQSLQQPTEIDVEIEMESEYIRMGGVKGVKGSSTKLSNPAYGCKKTDENGCLILKKI